MTSHLTPGSPEPLGVTPDPRGANVAVFSAHATAIELCLFDAAGETETARMQLPERTGDVFHGHVGGLRPGARYGFRAHGPFEPESGHRFNAHKLLVDPHALALDRAFVLHPSMFGYPPGETPAAFDASDSAPFMPKCIVTGPDIAPAPRRPQVAWDKSSVYEVHVRGFTRAHPDVPEAWRGTFAGLGSPAAIAHFTRLGITTLEIMPACAWIDERHLAPLGLFNVWGYNPAALMAPDPRLAPGGWAEIRAAVAGLQAAGIEVLLDVVLNHSGEGDEFGPTLSLRGLDNASYYRLNPAERALYVNDAGCGNILALDRAPVVRLAMDALRTWAQRAGLDGFRFDLATTMGRRDAGFDAAAPLLATIGQDSVLRDLKLIAEPWDIGPGGYQIGHFPDMWGEWNDQYRSDIRRFWRGDPGMAGPLATRLAGSADIFAAKNRPSRSINFITAHDGFTLADLVAYAHKHNLANGEDNRDGGGDNHSWNHGTEGASDDSGVRDARLRDQRNLLATLLLSRGTPMLAMGSERGHSQGGNNNGYAQDFCINWGLDDHGLSDVVRQLLALRAAHPALREDRFLSGEVRGERPDVQWLHADGGAMAGDDWQAAQTLVVLLATPGSDGGPADRAMIVLHRGTDALMAALPQPADGRVWCLALDTSAAQALPQPIALRATQARLEIAGRSVVVLVEGVRG